MRIIRLDETDSTNIYAKARLKEGENLVVTARRQTGGKGTKGRSFASREGGVYLSRLTFWRDMPVTEAFRIMANASVAVCRTLENYGLTAEIKWPNDVYVQGKKICGILIENIFSGDRISSSVVGIGVNVNNPLPEELRETAISMSEAAGHLFDREDVENTLIAETGKAFDMREYRRRVGFLNRTVTLLSNGEARIVRALEVDERGGLIVESGGKRERVTAAEVSLRLAALP